MMSLSDPDDDRDPSLPPNDNRPDLSRPYPGDNTGALEQAFQDAVNGVNLKPSVRFIQGQSFCLAAIPKLFRKLRGKKEGNEERLKDLTEIRDEVMAIKPPHTTISKGVDQGGNVHQFRGVRSDGPVDSISDGLVMGMKDDIKERDYTEVLALLLALVWELADMMEEYGLMKSVMDDDDGDDEDDDDKGDMTSDERELRYGKPK